MLHCPVSDVIEYQDVQLNYMKKVLSLDPKNQEGGGGGWFTYRVIIEPHHNVGDQDFS